MKQIQKLFSLTSLFLLFTFLSCATANGFIKDGEFYTEPEVLPLTVLVNENQQWKEVTEGITFTEYKIPQIKVTWKCVKIDLDTPGLKLEFAPNPYNIENWFPTFHVKTYMKNQNWIVGINTTPFDKNKNPVGIIKYKKDCNRSDPVENYSALVFSENPLRASILENQFLAENYDYSVGGFYTILKDQEIIEYKRFKRSRTACGTSENGRFLYLFATCADNCPSGRNGLNYEECAFILQFLGAEDAMEFDGGHSTALEIYGQKPVRPSLQRKVPAALGFTVLQTDDEF